MTDPMRIGLMTFVTDQSMPVTPLAREAEGRGFESLFVPEKTHLPVSRRTPWPGGDLPETYKRTYDPFVALATAAAVTSTLKLGTGSCIALTRDPIITAKEVASLDLLSGPDGEEYALPGRRVEGREVAAVEHH